jgi:hypothetical protein
MEPAHSSKTLVHICQTTWHYISKDCNASSADISLHYSYVWPSTRELGRLRLKCDGTRAETRFNLSAKRTNPFKSAGAQFSRLLAAELCASTVVMLDTPGSEIVWRVLATQSICQFPLHFPFRASPCANTFQLDSTTVILALFSVIQLNILQWSQLFSW